MVQEATKPLVEKTKAADLDQDDLALLDTLRTLNEAPEPEPDDKVIEVGDEDADKPPMVRTPTKSAGYMTLRRNSDGKLLPINKNQLAMRLTERLPDGRMAFIAPSVPWSGPPPGTLVCHFNPSHPDSGRLVAMGLRVECRKNNIKNLAELRIHERKKHKTDHASMEEIERRAREDEIREEQRNLNRAILAAVGGDTTVLDKVRETFNAPTPDEAVASIAQDVALTAEQAVEETPFLPTEEQPEPPEELSEGEPLYVSLVNDVVPELPSYTPPVDVVKETPAEEEREVVGGPTVRSPRRKPRQPRKGRKGR